MKVVFPAILLAVLVLIPSPQVAAQSPEMPLPGAVIKDADGKVIAQIVDFGGAFDSELFPSVLFDFGGVPSLFTVHPDGQFGPFRTRFYSGANCTGDLYLEKKNLTYMETWNQKITVIIGPDPTSGAYRVYRTTSWSLRSVEGLSYNDGSSCKVWDFGPRNVVPLAEILPNPLEGYRAPVKIAGGTRLP